MDETTIKVLAVLVFILFLVATPVLLPIHLICKALGRRGVYRLDEQILTVTLSPETFRKGSS